jgi:hypothetical protein
VLYVLGAASGATLAQLAGTVVGRNSDTTTMYFSPYTRIANDIGSMTISVPASLSTPSVSGSILTGGDQQISWSAISGASKYEIYQTEYNGSTFYTTYVGSTTGTSHTQSYLYATSYSGTSQPSSGTWVAYWVYAVGSAAISAQSTTIYFQTGTCSGRC